MPVNNTYSTFGSYNLVCYQEKFIL